MILDANIVRHGWIRTWMCVANGGSVADLVIVAVIPGRLFLVENVSITTRVAGLSRSSYHIVTMCIDQPVSATWAIEW